MAELLDTVARRGVDGERGYGEGVAAMASAMAWESKCISATNQKSVMLFDMMGLP